MTSVDVLRSTWSMLARRVAKLRGRSIGELRERIAQRVSAELERRRLSPMVGEPTDQQLQALLLEARLEGSGADTEALRLHFTKRTSPGFFDGVRDGRSAADLKTEPWTAARSALLAAAERILQGRFDLLGHTDLSFGMPIDWHVDPVSGRRAPLVHWSRIPYLDSEKIGDHKVIWELNRHQHFLVLGRAYQVTGQAKYADHFVEQLTSWMEGNPPKDGVNWASSLEVAYRAIAWLWALELFRGSDALNSEVWRRAVKFLYLHGLHLERYLSTYFSPNTHLTGEALGLFYLGVLLPELRCADRWRRRGWTILEDELPRQVHDDGVYFEHASYYHRYTVDIYLHAIILARRNGLAVPDSMLRRLELAMDHLVDLTRPDGSIPFIGDDDGGVLALLEKRDRSDVRASLGVASVTLERPDYAVVCGGPTEEVLWLLGPDGADLVRTRSTGEPPAHRSRLYRDGGYAIMRSGWGMRANHLVADAGPLGAMNCGHAHSDALSFELTVAGCPMLIDPGTYTYTGSSTERDAFRHSSSHNTLTVDGNSSSIPAGSFSWTSAADSRVERWWTGAMTDYFAGSHNGFVRLPDPALHRRSILFVRPGYWVVIDSVVAEGRHQAVAHFHGAAGSLISTLGASSAWIDVACAQGSARLLFSVFGDVSAVRWEEDWVSPVYGRKVLAPCIRVISQGTGRRDLITLLASVEGDQHPMVREVSTSSGRGVVIDRHGEGTSDLILVGTAERAQIGSIQMGAELALIRRDADGGELRSVALFGESARLSMHGITFEAAGAAEFVWDRGGWSIQGTGRVIQ